MLSLTRKPNDVICIRRGDDLIRVVVGRVDGCKVRVGVEAPPEFQIYREELVTDGPWQKRHAG